MIKSIFDYIFEVIVISYSTKSYMILLEKCQVFGI